MIKRAARKVAHFLVADKSSGSAAPEAFVALTQQRVPDAHDLERVEHGVGNVASVVDMIKNATTIKTGEYEALTRLFTGQKIYVDTRDISLAPHLMLDGVWEKEFTDFFRSFIKPESVVFDVGANFGYFALVAGTTVKREAGGSLHFFEANSAFFPYLQKTLSVNGLESVSHLVHAAVDRESGKTIDLPIYHDRWGSSGYVYVKSSKELKEQYGEVVDHHEKVKAISLDDYCKENKLPKVDVIQMDIEGAEENAYYGMRKVVKNSPDLVFFAEFAPDRFKDAAKFFNDMQKDFGYIYALPEHDGRVEPELMETYKNLKDLCAKRGDWITLLATKKSLQA